MTESSGATLRRLRKAAGMRQTELAAILRISQAFLCDVELGRRGFPPERLRRLPETWSHWHRELRAALHAELDAAIDT